MPKNIVQLNNRFIQDENQRRRYVDQERRKRNRLMGSDFGDSLIYSTYL